MANLVQVAKNTSVLPLPPSITGASGTRGLAEVTVTFANPITAGNDIIFSIMGNVANAACFVDTGPLLGIVQNTAGGSLPDRTYSLAITLTDATGRETMQNSTPLSIFVPANRLLRVVRPNAEPSSGHPGFSSWSIYVSGHLVNGAANLDPVLPQGGDTGWIEPTTGLTTNSTTPPTTPVQDTLGNSYVQCNFVSQFEGGSNGGNNAMGFYLARGSPGGSNAIKFVCGCWNANPGFEFDCDLSIIACEVTPIGTTEDSDWLKQHASSGVVSIDLTDSTSATRTTDWGGRNGNTAMVLDLSPAPGVDSFFAMFCNDIVGPDPPTPTLTGGTYTFIDSQIVGGIPHWLWFESPALPMPALACPLRNTGMIGQPFSTMLLASGGTPPYSFAILS